MKKLLLTTALTFVAFGSAASAQSVLERVLGQIDNSTNLASVNGTFANIAENIGTPTAVNQYAAYTGTSATGSSLAPNASQAQYDAWVLNNAVAQTYDSVGVDQVYYNASTGQVIRTAQFNTLTATQQAAYSVVASGSTLIENADGSFDTILTTGLTAELNARNADLLAAPNGLTTTYTGGLSSIDGSITNVIDGITDVTQQATAGTVTAIEYNMPTFDFGDMATTALGAVNTGEITLGVNSSVDNAKTSTTEALSSVMTQIGGSADTGAIVINVASNMTGVNGSIFNTMEEVNGSIGNLSTTALGAVNTGTIISGVNAAVTGITGATAGQ